MEKEKFQELQNELFASKTRKEWDSICLKIKELTINDEEARTALRNYLVKIKDKKFQYFEKYPPKEKKTFPIKSSYIFQDNLANALTEYIQLQNLKLKKELNLL